MIDRIRFDAPLGPIGRLVEWAVLASCLRVLFVIQLVGSWLAAEQPVRSGSDSTARSTILIRSVPSRRMRTKIMRVSSSSTVERLVGVFNADGTALGELSYFLRSQIGRAHCALCDVTHGRIRERDDWRQCRDRLPVSFATYHRDDQPASIRVACGGRTPVVAAEMTGGDVVMLLGPEDLEACGGSAERLLAAVEQAVTDAGLTWASS